MKTLSWAIIIMRAPFCLNNRKLTKVKCLFKEELNRLWALQAVTHTIFRSNLKLKVNWSNRIPWITIRGSQLRPSLVSNTKEVSARRIKITKKLGKMVKCTLTLNFISKTPTVTIILAKAKIKDITPNLQEIKTPLSIIMAIKI